MQNWLRKKWVTYVVFFLLFFLIESLFQFFTNQTQFPVAEIQSVELVEIEGEEMQSIHANLLTGPYRNTTITLSTPYSESQSYDLNYKVKDKVYVSLQIKDHLIKKATITDYKRDPYLMDLGLIFIFLMLSIGALKGFRSLMSIGINMLLFLGVIHFYLQGGNLYVLSGGAALLFILTSILIVNGTNQLSRSAIYGTILSSLLSLFIAVIVLYLSNQSGVHYEMMEYITRPPKEIFMVEILFGTLGGVMDIAITMSSSVSEWVAENPAIDKESLYNSGYALGEDIMGTMTTTLLFAYIGGSIPMIVLWLVNGVSLSFLFTTGLSLEIVRALTSSIGIVLSIPICLLCAVHLLGKRGLKV